MQKAGLYLYFSNYDEGCALSSFIVVFEFVVEVVEGQCQSSAYRLRIVVGPLDHTFV